MRTLPRYGVLKFVGCCAAALGLMLAACGNSGAVGPATAACTMVDPSAPPAALASDGRPLTIPALREWQAGAGIFRVCAESRILVAPDARSELLPVAEVLAEDLAQQGGRAMAVVIASPAAARPGDVILSLGEADARLGDEGYRLNVGPAITIRAGSPRGVFYGTRTLLQLLKQSSAIPAGEALDWPRYPERGLMVDAGRKYFTAEWLRQHLREIAYLKMNLFHFHFSENLGFRVESERHPEIVAEKHLSKAEVRELVALASRYFITVVPEIGMPGHMGAALAPHPEFQLKDMFGQAAPNQLDVTNPAAVQFARELIEEFLPLFPGKYWHTGADEYLAFYDYARYPQLQQHAQAQYGPGANGKDAIHGYINGVADLLAQHGKTTRAWGDDLNGGSAVTVNPDIVVEWWTDFQPLGDIVLLPGPQELLDRGHRILNASNWPTYLTFGGAGGIQPPPDIATAYETWDVHQFSGALFAGPVHTPYATVAADEPRNLGAKQHVWLDGGDAFATEDEVAAGIAPRLRVIAQKTWNSPLLAPSYAGFEPIADSVGHAPGGP